MDSAAVLQGRIIAAHGRHYTVELTDGTWSGATAEGSGFTFEVVDGGITSLTVGFVCPTGRSGRTTVTFDYQISDGEPARADPPHPVDDRPPTAAPMMTAALPFMVNLPGARVGGQDVRAGLEKAV